MKQFKSLRSIAVMLCLLATISLTYQSCSDDDDGGAKSITLSSLTAGDIDLNGATSPNNVPVDATVVATFSTDVDASTATDANVKLIRDYDDAEMDIDVTASDRTVTISTVEDLGSGTLYILRINGLQSEGGKILADVERNFTTAGAFAPAGVIAHYSFENNADDVVGDYDPSDTEVIDVTYVDSRNANAGQAASFNGTTTLIEIPNADEFMTHEDFAVSFWIKPTFSEGRGQFVLGLAGAYGFQFEIPNDWMWVKMAMRYQLPNGTDGEDSWYPGNGETKDNGGFQGTTINKDVSASGGVGETYFKDKWAHVVVTYNSTTKVNTMYINGEAVKEHDFTLFPDDNPKKNAAGVVYAGNPAPGNKLALGFIQSSENRTLVDEWADPTIDGTDPTDPANKHYHGLMDDVRIFSKPLTATEVTLMYNSEKP